MNSIIITLKINSNDKEMFDFSNYSAQQDIMIIQTN